MSNARKPATKPTSLDRYRSQVKVEPFVLWVDDEDKIEVPPPSGNVMFELESATSSKQVLELIGGAQADRLLEVLGSEDFRVMMAVADDMKKHFGLDQFQG